VKRLYIEQTLEAPAQHGGADADRGSGAP
jgi:hypothetical protein